MIDYYTVEYNFECRWSQKDIDTGLDKGSDLDIFEGSIGNFTVSE